MPKALPTRPRPATIAQDGLVVRRYGASGRGYTYNGHKFVSVSEVKDTLRKRMENWAAGCERTAILDLLLDVLSNRDLATSTPTGIRASLENALATELGGKFAWTRKLTEAGNIGHAVHDAIEKWLAWRVYEQIGGPEQPAAIPELDGPALVSYKKFVTWAEATDLMPIASELSVCSPEDKWGGTLDQLAFVEGVPGILDWKSGGGLYLEDHMQISAYRRGYNEYAPSRVKGVDRVDRAFLVHLPKKSDDAPTNIVQLETAELDHHYATFALAVPLCYRMKAWEAQRKAAA